MEKVPAFNAASNNKRVCAVIAAAVLTSCNVEVGSNAVGEAITSKSKFWKCKHSPLKKRPHRILKNGVICMFLFERKYT
jgi:hypothetical protein